MGRYVSAFQEIDRARFADVGGKGANLAELSRIDGIPVPAGFCVTTEAFRRVVEPAIADRLARLDDVAALSAEVREIVEGIAIPDDVAAEITAAVAALGEEGSYAVRSSATAEDLPGASFAGQQDSYLDVPGSDVLRHVSRCWASLFTERAVIYRNRNGFDQRKVQMAVVVQRMVSPDVAGVLFTADPVTGHRKVSRVEAVFGLGEALVSGRVSPDAYEVRSGVVVARTVAGERRALTDAQVLQLAALGRRIEAHFGAPQDIEWCLAGDDFAFVQARPITALFPIPRRDDREGHVYVSVGHQQMMTDAMKPLGISFWQLTAGRPMFEAGGRLFVDVTAALASPVIRLGLLDAFAKHDPLLHDAMRTLLDRGDLALTPPPGPAPAGPPPGAAPTPPLEADPALVAELIARARASLDAVKRDIRGKSGADLLDFILADLPELKRILVDPQGYRVFMTAIEAAWWLNDQLFAWLGEKNVADTLTQSVPNNVTSEMGLALLDVADAIRPHPDVVSFLERVDGDGFLDELPAIPGGQEARDAIQGWLDAYGMRCVGEIDITRPRWSERPGALVPVLLGNVRNFEAGAAARRFEQGRQEAVRKEEEVLRRLRALPDAEQKAAEAKRKIDQVRTFIGYREYPKYAMVSRYLVYKRALLDEAGRLARDGVLREAEDLFWCTFQELQEVVRTRMLDPELVRRRKEAFRSYAALTPPRVLTSDGEALTGAWRRDDLPADALIGLAVSAGTVEGRARVILDMADAALEPGDILVTAFTDPSWTPLFVAIQGLVTEVGGLMTHGAVIAREYGLPAVVGVEHATRRIRDGQRIRVHGTEGYVEIIAS